MTVQTTEPDMDLLGRFCKSGDADAFASIVQRYTRVVYSASIRILGDDGEAQDVSQETFFRLMQQPQLITVSLAGWLHRTATHLALDYRRSEVARKNREKTFGLDQQLARQHAPAWAELSPLIDQALDEIQEPARSLLIRHFLQSVPQADLAAELQISPATMSRRIKSALEELQRHLKQKGFYIGLVALIDFCTHHTAQAAPPLFFSEIGKMQMVMSLRPTTPMQPTGYLVPSPFRLQHIHVEYAPAKFAVALVVISAIVAAYALATTASWKHATLVSHPAPGASMQTESSMR